MKRLMFAFAVVAVMAAAVSCGQKVTREVTYKFYENHQERHLPDFSQLGEPDEVGVISNFALDEIPRSNENHYAILFTAPLDVAKTEPYTFLLTTDDGSRLYVDDSLIIEDDGARGSRLTTGEIELKKGVHQLKLEYFDFDKGELVMLMYSTPTIELRNYADPLPDHPEFARKQAQETYDRYAEWKGDDEVLVFPVITDLHTTGRDTWRHIGYVVDSDELFHYDFMTNLGDIGINLPPARDDIDYTNYIIDRTREQMALYPGVFLYAAGNHDWDGGEGTHITSSQLSEWFQKPALEKAGGNLHLVEGRCWGWYDIPEKNSRVIFLNSEATETLGEEYYCYGTEQFQWLADLLGETPEEWNVILLSHYMPHPIGRWQSATTLRPNCMMLMNILSDFKARKAGEGLGASWDFTSAQGRIIGLFCGDTHANTHVNEGGIDYFITEGYGSFTQSDMIPGQKHVWFDYRKSLSVDVIALKLATGEVHTFRMGDGGTELDYDWTVE